MRYVDPAGFAGRVINPGVNVGLTIATGPYPTNYRVSDGVTIGGILATGTSDGTLPIRIEPPNAGNGPMVLSSRYKFHVTNSTATNGLLSHGYGVDKPGGPDPGNKPMWPFLGVAHEVGTPGPPAETIQANSSRNVAGFRLDLLDNAFISDTPVATWPNWQLGYNGQSTTAFGTTLLYPALLPVVTNTGTVALTVDSVVCIAFCAPVGTFML